MFGPRASAELNRKQAEDSLRESEQPHRWQHIDLWNTPFWTLLAGSVFVFLVNRNAESFQVEARFEH